MTGIEKQRVDTEIQLLYYKYRGNVPQIVDACGYDATYVNKVCAKLRRRQKRDVDFYLAGNIMQYLMMGVEEQNAHHRDSLTTLMEHELKLVSICHLSRVISERQRRKVTYKCSSCQKVVTPILVPDLRVFKEKREILTSMKDIQKDLVEFALKLHFTNEPDRELPARITQYQVVLDGSNRKKVPSQTLQEGDAQVLQDIANMPPQERERIRVKLQKQLTEACSDDNSEE